MRIECFNTPSVNYDIDLHYCGYEDVETNFLVPLHTRECYLIHYIVKGEGFYECNKKKYPVNQGDIFTIFPGDLTSYYTNPSNPWSFCWFSFNGKRSLDLLSRAGITKSTLVRHLPEENQISRLVDCLVQAISSDRKEPSTKLIGYLYLLLADLEELHQKEENPTSKIDKKTEYVDQALKYIEWNYLRKITVQEIADFVRLERTYFSKLFHKHTGFSPQEYLIKYRIERAVVLMKTTNLSLNQICKSVGIDEEYYFSRIFKKYRGVSPKHYQITSL